MVGSVYTWLQPKALEQLCLPRQERIKIVNGEFWLGYEKAQEGLEKLVSLINMPKKARMPNLLILSPTNNGKTLLVKKFLRKFFSDLKEPGKNESYLGESIGDKLPALYLQMPSGPDLKRFYALIIHTLGLRYQTARASDLESQVLRLFKTFKIKMLLIDELHNILSGGANAQREFLNLLRFLGNELMIPIVGIGTKEAYLAIRSDDQLENRFEPFILPKWENNNEYLSLLLSFSKILPLRCSVDLSESHLAQKILKMSDGKIGEISTIIRKAAIFAIKHQNEQISEETFTQIDYRSLTERRIQVEKMLY